MSDLGTSYGEAHLDSEASYFGPSFMINWLHNSYGGYKAESILINCHYPVTQNSFVLQWGVVVEKPKGMDDEMTDKLSRVFTEGVSKGFLQDVEIWKHKTRIDNPLLVEEDAPSIRCVAVSAVLRRCSQRHSEMVGASKPRSTPPAPTSTGTPRSRRT